MTKRNEYFFFFKIWLTELIFFWIWLTELNFFLNLTHRIELSKQFNWKFFCFDDKWITRGQHIQWVNGKMQKETANNRRPQACWERANRTVIDKATKDTFTEWGLPTGCTRRGRRDSTPWGWCCVQWASSWHLQSPHPWARDVQEQQVLHLWRRFAREGGHQEEPYLAKARQGNARPGPAPETPRKTHKPKCHRGRLQGPAKRRDRRKHARAQGEPTSVATPNRKHTERQKEQTRCPST